MEDVTELDEISYQVISSAKFNSKLSKNLRQHLGTVIDTDKKEHEDICIIVKNTAVQVESEREAEFLEQIFERIGVDNIQVLQSMGRKTKILMIFKNPLETEIWYI